MNVSRRSLFLQALMTAGCWALGVSSSRKAKAETMEERYTKRSFELYPVGKVVKKGRAAQLRIFRRYADALKGLDGFSHVFVLYWFDRNDTREKRSILQVHPRGDRRSPLTGVFATRAPVRPNLIALSLCKIVSVKGNAVEVEKIDAFDESPVLDLKPYIPSIDSASQGIQLPGWVGTSR